MKYMMVLLLSLTVAGCNQQAREEWFRDSVVDMTNAEYDCNGQRGTELDDCERKLEQGRSVRR